MTNKGFLLTHGCGCQKSKKRELSLKNRSQATAGNAFIAQQIAQRLAARGWLPQSVQNVSVKDAAPGGQ
jgi:hypothetical protein